MAINPAIKIASSMPLKEGDPVEKNWRKINELERVVMALQAEIVALRSEANRRNQAFEFRHHPFKIYQIPPNLRAAQDPNTDWLNFRIRNGAVLTTTAGAIYPDVVGSDLEIVPDRDTYPALVDIAVPAGTAKYWFWINVVGAVATLKYGADPAAAGWGSFPITDSSNIPIGWVDTLTLQATKQARIRQLLRTDIISAGGSGSSYQREYDPLKTYSFGDLVRVRSGNSQGAWICVSAIPIIGSAPVWPEPPLPNWEILSFGVQSANNCMGTAGTIYFNGQPGL